MCGVGGGDSNVPFKILSLLMNSLSVFFLLESLSGYTVMCCLRHQLRNLSSSEKWLLERKSRVKSHGQLFLI